MIGYFITHRVVVVVAHVEEVVHGQHSTVKGKLEEPRREEP